MTGVRRSVRAVMFSRELREAVASGEITVAIRLWSRQVWARLTPHPVVVSRESESSSRPAKARAAPLWPSVLRSGSAKAQTGPARDARISDALSPALRRPREC